MTGITNSRHAWPDEGVTRVPYFVYDDADLYEDEQRLIFRGPVWNYLGLEIEIPTAGDYITSHVGDTPVIVLRREDGSISAVVNDQLESGPDFFVEDGKHLITTRDNHARKRPIGIMFCAGRGMMQDCVTALRKAIVFEPHSYRHIVGSALITPVADGSYAAESNFHILRIGADGGMITYGCGRYLDEIVHFQGAMAFVSAPSSSIPRASTPCS